MDLRTKYRLTGKVTLFGEITNVFGEKSPPPR